ncbi:HU family DNA-binding protein [Prevotella sp. HUN102]|uniref:HU family DNA-binding protein n=1 Tax=Prevotella sp. HUN102 TaxID=1392486 RepID=UPI00048FB3D1|nr:HU family DNA-binding protein [Prevotella sp. HUN102]
MAKTAMQLISEAIAKKHKLTIKEADKFVALIFQVVNEGLKNDKLVKIKGLGTFKVQAVKPRESINVNTGERVLIEGHEKVNFTPDAYIKELVNKPFSEFETVVLKDGVEFDDENPVADAENDAMADAPDAARMEESVTQTAETVQETEPEIVPMIDDTSVKTEETELQSSVRSEEIELQTSVKEKVEEPEKETVVQETETEIATKETEPIAESPVAVSLHSELSETRLAVSDEENAIADVKSEEPVLEIVHKPEAVSLKETPSEPEKILTEMAQPVTPEVRTVEAKAATEPSAEGVSVPKKRNLTPWITLLVACLLVLVIWGVYTLGKHSTADKDKVAQVEEAKGLPKEIKENEKAVTAANTDSVAAEAAPQDEAAQYKALSSNPKIKYGAYDIIGVEKVVVLKKGETMASYSKKTLGPDMVGYFQVLNGVDAMEEGDTMKVPKVEYRPEYR